ncbi:CbiM family transporter [Proteinivorax tanatarense]|uniref:CbiM family transporter n=1 Tax=Proteinivorax tanatarense TaxID=1260629 RepID=A0AAU7VR04_9FIRM
MAIERGGKIMHIADGVLSTEVAVGTSVAAAGLIGYALYKVKEDEIPKISIMTAAFFAFALISIPIGPSSAHPLLAGLLGITLKRRSPIAIFVGLLLHAMLFQHGGITTLGVNTLLIGIPAIISWQAYDFLSSKHKNPALWGGVVGALGVILCTTILVGVLWMTDARYHEGFISNINLLILAHTPLLFIEGGLTAFAVRYLSKSKKVI